MLEKTQTKDDCYYKETKKPVVVKSVKSNPSTVGYDPCVCVSFVRAKTGYTRSFGPKGKQGWARYWPVNSNLGAVGGVIVLNESKSGHVALIIGINVLGYIVDEANYSTCKHTMGRLIPFNDPAILGFWQP